MSEQALRKLALLPLIAAAVGLLFRMLLWQSWAPVPREPYGASDLIELLLVGVTATCGVIAVSALVLVLARRSPSRRMAWSVALAAFAGPALHWYLHPLVPTFRLW